MNNLGYNETEPIEFARSSVDETNQGNNSHLKINLSKIKNYNSFSDKSDGFSHESIKTSDVKPHHLNCKTTYYTIKSILKIILFFFLLYLFLLSINFMSIGFTLISGYAAAASDTIKYLLSNPFAALSIGILVTALIQNATAITSVVVSMVGAGIITDVKLAIPIVMGANLGTCFTNALIALTLSGNLIEFKRAISSATFNDMFNLLTIALLLPCEILTNFLYHVSYALTNLMPFENSKSIASINFVQVLLNPIIDKVIILDDDAVDRVANGGNDTVISLRCCPIEPLTFFFEPVDNSTDNLIFPYNWLDTTKNCSNPCTYLSFPLVERYGDGVAGGIFILVSLIVLILCLFGIVKVLTILIVGPIASAITIAINASFKGRWKIISDIILFMVAIFITIVVQSSNIVTATLVPLCGIGIITLQRVYILTLGSNIGTTITGILTAFASPPSSLKKSMQLALVYTLFNVLGVLLWLPIPKLRVPKFLASKLGDCVFKYNWFVFVYITNVYFLIPLLLFGLSFIPHYIGLAVVGIPVITLILVVLIYRTILSIKPDILPLKYRDLNWLPLWLRSLEPLDRKIQNLTCCAKPQEDLQSVSIIAPEIAVSDENAFNSFIRRCSVVESLVVEARESVANTCCTNSINEENEER